MSLNQESISAQLALLATHRRTLTHLLQQAAQFDGEVFALPQTANGIAAARIEIQQIKTSLRENGIPIEDQPNDAAPPLTEIPLPHATTSGAVFNQPNWTVRGDIYNVAVDQTTTITPLDRQQQRNRRAMLTKMKTIWIDGLLEQSLAKELRIALDLNEQLDAVDRPLNMLIQELNRSARPLPSDAPIIKVFNEMGSALLILGAPGAGKTTLLLELARDLIEHAEQDKGHPIPVVFNLSSWATKRQLLKHWLVEELNNKYDVPRMVAQTWIDTDAVLPLLDGLDEVAAGQRDGCVEAINTYRQEHGLVPLAVCSRVTDYEALSTKLRLHGAVVVQALSQQQIDMYLDRAGAKLVGLRAAVHDDPELKQILETPLMLTIATVAYRDKPVVELQDRGTRDEQRKHLFDAYIAVMFQRRNKEIRYTQRQTNYWLRSLAQGMVRQSQTVFLLEDLQQEWLPTRAVRFQYVLLDRFISALGIGLLFGLLSGRRDGLVGGLGIGLLFGLLILLFGGQTDIETLQQRSISRIIVDALLSGLVGGLVGGLIFELVFSLGGVPNSVPISVLSGRLSSELLFVLSGVLGGGLLFGLLGVLTGKPGVSSRRVIIIARLRWRWGKAWRSALSGLVVGMIIGMIVGLVGGLVGGLVFGLAGGLVFGLVGGLVFGLAGGLVFGLVVGLLGGLVGGLSSGQITRTIHVNQGIRHSAQSALVGGLVGVLGGGLFGVLGNGLDGGLASGLALGLLGVMSFGGYTCLSHLSLRLTLSRNGYLPLDLKSFLDYCAARIFLHKVGGGYIFIHRLLMEHFASAENAQSEETAQQV